MQTEFILLGSGAGPGVPSFFCNCIACQEAKKNPRFCRTRSGAFINAASSKILIDTPPDLRQQLIRENITQIDYLFFTHWHYDHFGGIGELEYYVKLQRKKPIAVFLPPSAVTQFLAAFPGLAEDLDAQPWEFHKQYRLENVCLTPLPANHGIETAGFLLEAASKKRIAYFPDTAGLSEQTAGQVGGVDWLFCDATFHGENWFPHAHMSIDQAIELGKAIQAKNTVLTHLAIHYSRPVIASQLAGEGAKFKDVHIGYDGMRICF